MRRRAQGVFEQATAWRGEPRVEPKNDSKGGAEIRESSDCEGPLEPIRSLYAGLGIEQMFGWLRGPGENPNLSAFRGSSEGRLQQET